MYEQAVQYCNIFFRLFNIYLCTTSISVKYLLTSAEYLVFKTTFINSCCLLLLTCEIRILRAFYMICDEEIFTV